MPCHIQAITLIVDTTEDITLLMRLLITTEAFKYNKVEVVTGNCSSKGHLKHNVNIPKWWYKIIYIPSIHKTLAFLAPNTNARIKTAKIKKYKTTIEKIKQVCGF